MSAKAHNANHETLDLAKAAKYHRDILLDDDAFRKSIDRQLRTDRLQSLKGQLQVLEITDEHFRITGPVTAKLQRKCTLTLEPITEAVTVDIDQEYVVGSDPLDGEEEVELDANADLPDYIESPEISLTTLVTEAILLALDPYPRKPGIALDDVYHPSQSDVNAGPFEALARLRKN